MTFSYDGSCFKGYQRQNKIKTVQGEIEKVLSSLNNGMVTISSSGRTDTGVHAKCQKAHFDLDKNISCYSIKTVLNSSFNKEIYVSKVEEVKNDFHARYNVIKKEYRYFINIGDFNIFERNYVYQYNKPLDIDKLKEALKLFEGTHDFKSLCNNSKEKNNFVRTILKTSVKSKNNIIEISIIGDGFLRQMVRNIVGLLIAVASSKIEITDIEKIMLNKDRSYNIKGALSCGLYLWNVYYK